MSGDDYAVCVRPDEPSYAEVCAQRDELLAALVKADALLSCTVDEDWRRMRLPPPSRKDRDARKAAIAKCKEVM